MFLFGVQNDLQKRRSEMAVVRGKLRDLKHSQVRARRYFQEYEQGLKQKMQHLDTAEEKVCIRRYKDGAVWVCTRGVMRGGCVPGGFCGVCVYQEGHVGWVCIRGVLWGRCVLGGSCGVCVYQEGPVGCVCTRRGPVGGWVCIRGGGGFFETHVRTVTHCALLACL